jgi:hypothetical protein
MHLGAERGARNGVAAAWSMLIVAEGLKDSQLG